jgi:hypothetical protein
VRSWDHATLRDIAHSAEELLAPVRSSVAACACGSSHDTSPSGLHPPLPCGAEDGRPCTISEDACSRAPRRDGRSPCWLRQASTFSLWPRLARRSRSRHTGSRATFAPYSRRRRRASSLARLRQACARTPASRARQRGTDSRQRCVLGVSMGSPAAHGRPSHAPCRTLALLTLRLLRRSARLLRGLRHARLVLAPPPQEALAVARGECAPPLPPLPRHRRRYLRRHRRRLGLQRPVRGGDARRRQAQRRWRRRPRRRGPILLGGRDPITTLGARQPLGALAGV